VHALDGMAMVMKEGTYEDLKPPKGFPICQNFYNDHEIDTEYVKRSGTILRGGSCIYVKYVLDRLVLFGS